MKINSLFKIDKISRMDLISRWDLNNTIKKENNSQHSFWTAFFATSLIEELLPDNNCSMSRGFKLDITRFAIFHDVDEIFTGDINHIVKNNNINGEQIVVLLKQLVGVRVEENFGNPTFFNRMIKQYLIVDDSERMKIVKGVVKLADWLSFIKYIDNEKSLGNNTIDETRCYCVSRLEVQIQKVKKLLTPYTDKMLINFEILDNII